MPSGVEPSGYIIQGLGPGGLPDDSISLENQFGATERLAIEGGADGPQAKVRGELDTLLATS